MFKCMQMAMNCGRVYNVCDGVEEHFSADAVQIPEAIYMRKSFLMLIFGATLLALSACGGAGDDAVSEVTGDSGTAQMPNPLVLSSLEEIGELDGVSISLPDAAKNVTAIRINTDPVVDSVTFESDGQRYVYRVSKADMLTDISGMYYDWGEPEGGEVPENAPKCFIAAEGQGVMLWYREGQTFRLAVTEGAEFLGLTGMYQKLDDGTVIS